MFIQVFVGGGYMTVFNEICNSYSNSCCFILSYKHCFHHAFTAFFWRNWLLMAWKALLFTG